MDKITIERETLEQFRDDVLHQRGPLAENGMTGDQINDVLGLFDDAFAATLAADASVKESFTVAEQSMELDAGMAAQHYCRRLWGAARGHPEWRKVHEHFSSGYKQGRHEALRAALAAQPAEPARCRYCDGTGDVHTLDGEWRGTCTECNFSAQEPRTQKEKEQYAFEDWLASECPSGDVESVQSQWEASAEYLELRDDTPAQPAPAAVPLTDEKIDHTLATTLDEFARTTRGMSHALDVNADITANSRLRRMFARAVLAAAGDKP